MTQDIRHGMKQSIMLSIIFFSIISAGIASAEDKTYYWNPSSGNIGSSGFTANWGSCNAQPTSYRVTTLSSTGFTCNSDRLTRTSSGDQFLAIFPTSYSSDTQIEGKTDATFYLASRDSDYTAKYRFDLGYAKEGTFNSLGYVTQTTSSSSGRKYTINMSNISGTAPSGSYLALKVSVTTSKGGRVYLGTNGGSSGSNSGRFYVSEMVATPTPTPTTPTPAPTTPTPAPTTPTPAPTTPTPTPTTPTGGQIKLGTDRFVILDDDIQGTTETGFVNPLSGWSGNVINGKATTIGAYALFLDENGKPVQGKNITFTFYKPAASGVYQTKYTQTDSNGVASSFSNLDSTFFYGRWKVKAESNSLSATSNFIYNWWGCNYNSGSCDEDHESKDWNDASTTTINSPYLTGKDKTVGEEGDHYEGNNGVCTGCHRSFDGTNGTSTSNYPSSVSTIQSGIHAGIRCDNTSCHNTISTHRNNAVIGSCYGGTGCHPFRTDISGKSTLNGVVSAYSNSTGKYNKYHTSDSTVLCVVCHGPMHNTTKPAESQRLVKNNITENEHCWTCHTNRETTHMKNSNCVICHSQDAHNISGGGGGPDCKACHNIGSSIKVINFSAANSSAHKDLNSGAYSTVDAENKKCWACHGDGVQPVGDKHPPGYNAPKICENCHTGETGVFGAPIVREHNQNGEDVKTTVACILCHDNDGMFIYGGGIGTITHYIKDVTNTAMTPYEHLGPINTSNCLICHRGQYTADPIWGSPVNITTGKMQHPETTTQCDGCHKDSTVTTLANVDFHHPTLGAGGGSNCVGCHAGAE